MDIPSSKKAGQQYDPELDAVLRFWEQEVRYGGPDSARVSGKEGTNRLDLTPTDHAAQKVREWNITAIQAVLDATSIIEHTNIDRIQFPLTLTAVTTVVSKSHGDGSDSMPASQIYSQVYYPGGGGFSPNSQAQGSASVAFDVLVDITENEFNRVPGMIASFYIADNSTRAQVLAKAKTVLGLGTDVLDWPQFHPKAHNFVLLSSRVNVSVRATTRAQVSSSNGTSGSESYEWGQGSAYDIDLNLKGVRIAPTIHGAISVGGTLTDTETASAVADAGVPELVLLTRSFGPQANTLTSTKDASGSIRPTSLTATTPAAIPVTGYYAWDLQPGPSRFGRTPYRIMVVNATAFA